MKLSAKFAKPIPPVNATCAVSVPGTQSILATVGGPVPCWALLATLRFACRLVAATISFDPTICMMHSGHLPPAHRGGMTGQSVINLGLASSLLL